VKIKILKKSAYVIVFAIFSAVLSGCTLIPAKKATTNTAPTITQTKNANDIVVWSFEDSDVWKPIEGAFEAENPGFTLTYKKEVLDAKYESRVLNSILSGEGPDLWAMPNDWVYRHKDKLAPMPTITDPKTKATSILYDISKNLIPAVKQSVYFNDNAYALTPAIDPLEIYWNTEIFAKTLDDYRKAHNTPADTAVVERATKLLSEPPKTWADFTETVKLLTKRSGNDITTSGLAVGTEKVPNSQDILYLLMLQNGTQITSEDLLIATYNLSRDTTSGLKDIPGKRALEFYTSFADPASANYSWNDNLGNATDAFANGKVAMIFGYGSLDKYFLKNYPTMQAKYRRAFVPQIGQEQYKIIDYAKFNAYGVSGISSNIGLVWSLNAKLTSAWGNNLTSANGTSSPMLSTAKEFPLANRNSGTALDIEVQTAQTFIKGRNPIAFDQTLNNTISAINSKIRDTQSVIDLSALTATELLKSSEWK